MEIAADTPMENEDEEADNIGGCLSPSSQRHSHLPPTRTVCRDTHPHPGRMKLSSALSTDIDRIHAHWSQ